MKSKKVVLLDLDKILGIVQYDAPREKEAAWVHLLRLSKIKSKIN